MYNLVICDDEPLHLRHIRALVERFPTDEAFNIHTCASADELLRIEHDGLCPDILLMDIRLGGDDEENGIALIKQLNVRLPDAQVIYVTGYMEYCTAVYETKHVYFITKPIKPEELNQAIRRALEKLKYRIQGHGKLLIKVGYRNEVINLDSIRYLESEGRKVKIYCDTGLYETYAKNKDIAAQLDARFVLCHKSFIVNLDAVTAMTSSHFELKSGPSIPIGRSLYAEVKARFLHHLGGSVWAK